MTIRIINDFNKIATVYLTSVACLAHYSKSLITLFPSVIRTEVGADLGFLYHLLPPLYLPGQGKAVVIYQVPIKLSFH